MADQPPTIITPVVFFGYEDRFDATPEQRMAKRADFRPRPVQSEPTPEPASEEGDEDPKVSSVTEPASGSSGEPGSKTSEPEVPVDPANAEKVKQESPDLGGELL